MIKKEVLIGFISGVIGAALGTALCTFIISKKEHTTFNNTLTSFQNDDKLWMLICLGSIINLGLFFFFLQKDKEYRARGILLATFLTAFIAYAIYFF